MIKKTWKQDEEVDNFNRSFIDMITLLLVFFVYLYSISNVNYNKFVQGSQSLSEGMKSQVQVSADIANKMAYEQKELQKMKKELDQFSQDQELDDVLKVDYIGDHLEVNLGDALLFETGSSELKAEAIDVLITIGKKFVKTEGKIVVEGHTDDLPIETPTYPSNWELSSARAASVVRFLSSQGVKESRCTVIGVNQYNPSQPNDSETHRAQNRRVKIILKAMDYEKMNKKDRRTS